MHMGGQGGFPKLPQIRQNLSTRQCVDFVSILCATSCKKQPLIDLRVQGNYDNLLLTIIVVCVLATSSAQPVQSIVFTHCRVESFLMD